MKRYLVFSGLNYEAKGGWDDFDCDLDSVKECVLFIEKDKAKWRSAWYQIIDTNNKKEIIL